MWSMPKGPPGRPGEQRRRRVLADPVVGDGVPAVEHLLVGGVEHLEGRHDLAGGQHLDLHRARGELVDALGENAQVVLERDAGRPGRLHLERLRRLRACGGTERKGSKSAAANAALNMDDLPETLMLGRSAASGKTIPHRNKPPAWGVNLHYDDPRTSSYRQSPSHLRRAPSPPPRASPTSGSLART